MPAAHIAGIPVEETLLSFGGPAAIYVMALGLVSVLRRTRSRLGAIARRRLGVGE